jgi:hypothetical protein
MAENARELGLDYDAPVVTSDTSQERVDETAKQRHDFECPRCGHCCQQREWVGLTHEEIDYQAKKDDHAVYFALGALWAEAKLKERNT